MRATSQTVECSVTESILLLPQLCMTKGNPRRCMAIAGIAGVTLLVDVTAVVVVSSRMLLGLVGSIPAACIA